MPLVSTDALNRRTFLSVACAVLIGCSRGPTKRVEQVSGNGRPTAADLLKQAQMPEGTPFPPNFTPEDRAAVARLRN